MLFLCAVIAFAFKFCYAYQKRFGVFYVVIAFFHYALIKPGVDVLKNVLRVKYVSALTDDKSGERFHCTVVNGIKVGFRRGFTFSVQAFHLAFRLTLSSKDFMVKSFSF